MSKIKIEKVALEAGANDKDAIKKAKELGFKVKSKNSTISAEDAEYLMDYLISGKNPIVKNTLQNIWIISPGEKAKIWDDCKNNGYIAIGWDKIDVNKFDGMQVLKRELINSYGEKPKNRKANFLWYFAKIININDIIIARKGQKKIVGIGIVISDYISPYSDNNPRKEIGEYLQIRKVKWLDTDEYTISGMFKQDTLSKINSDDNRISEVINNNKELILEYINKEDNMNEKEVLADSNEELNSQDNDKVYKLKFSTETVEYNFEFKNILLKGVPGTGKSRTIDKIIEKKLNLKNKYSSNILRINIHSASSNADLMQGIAINSNSTGNIEYNEKQGLILRHIEKAIYNPNQPFVLILEEIQENSLNELIGDLIYLIEDDKRAKDYNADNKDYTYEEVIKNILNQNKGIASVILPSLISDVSTVKEMIIPHNLFIFCTSNYKDDKKVIEDNLLRRFEVIEIYPRYKEDIKDKFKNQEVSDFLKYLNISIVESLSDNGEIHPDRFMIGHSIWLNVTNKKDFARAFLKVIIEFKDIKDLHFEEFKKIIQNLNFPFKIDSNYDSYQHWINYLQKESYDFLY